MKRKIAILGATGSIGTQTIDIAREFKDEIEIVMMSANVSYEKLCALANEFSVPFVAINEKRFEDKVKSGINYDAHFFCGEEGTKKALEECGCDTVVIAVVGMAGLPLFEKSIDLGLEIALANKESLVCGGSVAVKLLEEHKINLLPVDSEHCAIYECLGNSFDASGVKNIIITASGGPFRGKSREELKNVTPKMAANHPKWSMGRKISIDSATLANKGLEVMEAYYMFKKAPENIKVLVHPQSIVHSMVEFNDCSIIAQMSPVDMRLPVQKALLSTKEKRYAFGSPLDFAKIGSLTFENPDLETFRCLQLAYDAIKMGRSLTAVYNDADEGAVDAFVKGKIAFNDIPKVIEDCMDKFYYEEGKCIEEIMHINTKVRKYIEKNFN